MTAIKVNKAQNANKYIHTHIHAYLHKYILVHVRAKIGQQSISGSHYLLCAVIFGATNAQTLIQRMPNLFKCLNKQLIIQASKRVNEYPLDFY